MAQGNLFLGTARKSVGDVTFYNSRGKQISRVRRRVISNPRSALQVAQRVVLKTCSTAYSLMSQLCSETFEGKTGAWQNQARFQLLNMRLLRAKWMALTEFTRPDTIYLNEARSYCGRGTLGAVPNDYFVSEGSLPFGYDWGASNSIALPGHSNDIPTYAQACEAMGINVGDQLTFVVMFVDDTEPASPSYGAVTGFEFARVIMAPSSGDAGTTPLFSQSGSNGYLINAPNASNRGSVAFVLSTARGDFLINNINGREIIGGGGEFLTSSCFGLILSRRLSTRWVYSTCQLKVNTGTSWYDATNNIFGAAVESWMGGEADGTKYLDAAKRG